MRVSGLKFFGNFTNGVADVFSSFLGCFEPKKILYKFLIFWVFLHTRGHANFWKITKLFFESYGPEIHRKLQKWCCGRILKLFRLFRAEIKFCINFLFFEFLAYPGSWNFWKITKFFFESNRPEIHWKLHKWCCGRISKLFRLFRAKNKFCINFSFFGFFCIPGVMHFFDKSLSSFLRVTGLKFIGNFKNGVADVFQSFLGCFQPKKILYKFFIFWFFLHIRGHGIFEKSLSSFLRVTGLKFIGNFKNGVANVV